MNPYTDGELDTFLLFQMGMQVFHRIKDAKPSTDGSLRIVFVRLGIAKVHEESIAQKLRGVSFVALDDFSTSSLIGSDYAPVVFRVELAGQFGGIDQVTKHDSELPSFRVGRRRGSNAKCDRRWLFLHSRLWCWLSRGSGEFLSAYSSARPDEPSIIFINYRMGEK
jgi:hypothetical protein